MLTLSNLSHADNSGSSRQDSRLPEPMVFDLVCPLGATRNEHELNTLFQYDQKHQSLSFDANSEFEYAYRDGYGIEFELPTHRTIVEAYKVSLQDTFDFLNTRHFIHGWQYIGEYHRKGKEY
ncbi:MAG: hypothetical protein KBA82_08910 [Nitrosomonas sp.]|nr:hypothetical protein [Nitrosomonas sp.]MBP7113076.1 hypothetical protein [Nitrosomonas sp.]